MFLCCLEGTYSKMVSSNTLDIPATKSWICERAVHTTVRFLFMRDDLLREAKATSGS